jgi:hypothetical protein
MSLSVVSRRALSGFVALFVALFVGLAIGVGSADAAELSASPSSLAATFSSAQGGDTILLAAGTYSGFRGGTKSARVTIKPQPGAAVTMSAVFNPAANITLQGLTISSLEIDGTSRDITVRDSAFTGRAILRTVAMSNANVLLDNNTHLNINVCSGCYAGRIHLPERGSQTSGVTIQNSRFSGGSADGIQNGANGARILNNTFIDLQQGDPNIAHTDAIQLYGSKNTLIKSNYFTDVASAIMAPDGADQEIIEDNVFAADPGGYPFVIMLWSDNASTVRHNTLADGSCSFNLRCGIISLGSKSGQPSGRGTIIQDNVLGEISNGGGSATWTSAYNLLRSGTLAPTDIRGLPTYTGGSAPTTYPGHQLTPTSLGANNASDNLDRGARITTQTTPANLSSSGEATQSVRHPAKLSVARARIDRRAERLSVLAPITRRASGEVAVELHAAGKRTRFTVPVDSTEGVVRFDREIPDAQARRGTGIITLAYGGDGRTRPQEIRLRAASRPAALDAERPVLRDGHLRAAGSVSRRARGVVRVTISYVHDGDTHTVGGHARIRDGAYKLDLKLSEQDATRIENRSGTVHSSTQYTGYQAANMRGEAKAYQVLGSP